MWHVLVAVWLQGTVVVYALPQHYTYKDSCLDRVDYLVDHWEGRRGAHIGFKCARRALSV